MVRRVMSLLSTDIEKFTHFAGQLADAAAVETLRLFRTSLNVTNKLKDDFDPVTLADQNAEKAIRSLITTQFPDHGILGEEFGETKGSSSFRWILDPIDGTRSFIAGVPTWTTLIALEVDGVPLISIIDQPYIGERWVGMPGSTCFERDGKTSVCHVTKTSNLADAIISTTDPSPAAYFTEEEAAKFAGVSQSAKLTRYSCDAYAYAVLASGGFDAVIEAGLNYYDAAALIPVVKGAGGLITDWQGDEVNADWAEPQEKGGKGGQLVAAATPGLQKKILQSLA